MSRKKLSPHSSGTAPERGAHTAARRRRYLTPLLSGAGSLALIGVGAHTLVLLSNAAHAPVPDLSTTSLFSNNVVSPPIPIPNTPVTPEGSYPGAMAGAPSAPAVPMPGAAPQAAGPQLAGPPAPGSMANGMIVPRIGVPTGPMPPIASGGLGGLPGRIGPMGPVSGPLNTDVSGIGPVRGPYYGGKPLPSIAGGVAMAPPASPVPGSATTAPAPTVAPAVTNDNSELPTERTVALSRLANPLPQARTAAATPAKVDASAEKPLGISLSVGKSAAVGDAVPVRMSANVDCYAAIFRLDASGNATTLFRWSSPSRSFACLLRPTAAGQEQLVAVASVHPLNGADVAAALRGAGAGFAVAPASSLGGGAKGWQRHEWSVATAGLSVAAPAKVAAVKPSAPKVQEKSEPSAPKTAVRKPAPSQDGSTLPTALPEKSDMRPVVEKPVEKPEAPPAKEEMKPVQPAAAPSPKNEMKPLASPAEKPADAKPAGSGDSKEESQPGQ